MKQKDKTEVKKSVIMDKKEAKEHVGTLKRLQEKDPEFYEFLKEHDKELLEFDEEDVDDIVETDVEEEEEEVDDDTAEHSDPEAAKEEGPSRNVITSAMVDSWCDAIRDGAKLGAVRSLLRAFRSACHYGDDNGDDPTEKFSTMSSGVFNKIMVFVLNEMDGILRGLLKLPASGGKKELVMDLMTTRRWKNYNHLVKSYLGNSLHVLNQMTDNEMIAFMLRRLKFSSVFLAAFPAILRKYIKVALHFWGTGSGALPVVSFLFLRDSCVRLGSDCLDDCIRGMYKAYVLNCHFVNATKLQHIQFLSNCITELLRVDIPSAYQHTFVYIRQLAMILKEALSSPTKLKSAKNKGKDEPSKSKKEKGKEAPSSSTKKEIFRKVYQWKFINCLELWTGVVCANSSGADLRPLAYPLTQIITGVARLVPSACYFPLRLRCMRMLNRISASTGSFIPVSLLLLDMLDIKELHKPPTGGVGKAVDLFSILKVSKSILKTRAFQEACVFSVVEELTEHLAQWSYSVAFLELSFVPCVRLRNFCKSTKVDRFRKEIRHLIRQIEANSDFVNKKRTTISFLPNDPAAASFLEDEKKSGTSPLSQYVATLRQRAQERNDSLIESSVLVGDGKSKFGNKITSDDEFDDSEDEESVNLLLSRHHSKHNKPQKNVKTKNIEHTEETGVDEDVIEDFVLSSDEDNPLMDSLEGEEDVESEEGEKPVGMLKAKGKRGNRKSKKRKRTHVMSDFLSQCGGVAIIDGGLATELECHGANLNDPLWSAKCLLTSPHLIRSVHLDYLEAGADIIITASYQATIQGFESKGYSLDESENLLRKSVEIAREAREVYYSKFREASTDGIPNGRILNERPILVAASVGSYGAYLADGSEYRCLMLTSCPVHLNIFSGDYGEAMDLEFLKNFHRRRVKVLADSGPDIIAFETVPNKLEAQAFAQLLKEEHINIPAWLSFNSKDGVNVVSGDSLSECVAIAESSHKIVAVGINCTPPRFIRDLILSIKKVTTKPILIYPNSGESYDAHQKEWVQNTGVSDDDFVSYVNKWCEDGASLVGGCCRTTPQTTRAIYQTLLCKSLKLSQVNN